MQYNRRASFQKIVFASDPAAGAPVTFTVPAGVLWTPIAGEYLITTVASTGAAAPTANINDPDNNTVWDFISSTIIAAAKVCIINFTNTGSNVAGSLYPSETIVFPDVTLLPASTITYSLFADVGPSQVSGAQLTVLVTLLGY